MHPCPSCTDSFGTQRGLAVHHSKIHGEKLPNRTCDHCGAEFHSPYEKRYCSEECLDGSDSFEGEDHPNWSGGKETTECVICSSEFEYYPSEKEGLYCGTCVENKNRRYRPDTSAKNHPQWTGGTRKVDCDRCEATVVRRSKHITGEHVFCSPKCQCEWLSAAFIGEGHPNWEGGTNPNYGRGWRRARERALERDGHECVICGATRCVICGATRDDLGRNPDVHHIVPVRAFLETPITAEFDAHYRENLVSLCPSCHRRAEFGHIDDGRLHDARA